MRLAQQAGCLRHREGAANSSDAGDGAWAQPIRWGVGELQRAIDGYDGQPATAAALGLRRRWGIRRAWRGKMSGSVEDWLDGGKSEKGGGN